MVNEVDGDRVGGVLRVRLGPLAATYEGTVRLDEVSRAAGLVVATARGHDIRAQGELAATVRIQLSPNGEGTSVAVASEVSVTGKLARFGPGVMGDLATHLAGQFAPRLDAVIARPHIVEPPPDLRPAGPPAATPAFGPAPDASPATARRPVPLPERLLPAMTSGLLVATALNERRRTRLLLAAAGIAAVAVIRSRQGWNSRDGTTRRSR